MAIVKIQNRRGNYSDFDDSKLLPGEVAVVQSGDPNSTDGESVYIRIKSGSVKQIATKEEMQSEIETALQEAIPEFVGEATQEAKDAADRAETAALTFVTDKTLSITERPADAKVTGDTIETTRQSISQMSTVGFKFSADNFIIGARGKYGSNVPTSTTTRITTKVSTIDFDADITFTPDEQVKYYFYFSDGTRSGWLTETYTLTKRRSVTLVIAYVEDDEVTSIQDLLNHLSLNNPLQAVIEELQNDSDAMAVDINTIRESVTENTEIIRESISQVSTTGFKFSAENFVIGARGKYGSNTPTSATNRVTPNRSIIDFDADITFHSDGQAKYYFFFSDGTNSGWLTGDYILTKRRSVTLVIGYVDDTEITDIQTLLDHISLNNSLQKFVIDASNQIEDINEFIFNDTEIALSSSDWQTGYMSTRVNSSLVASTTRITLKNRISVSKGEAVFFTCPSGYKYRVLFFANTGAIQSGVTYSVVDVGIDDLTVWHSDNTRMINIPDGVAGMAISFAHTDDSTMPISEGINLGIVKLAVSTRLKNIGNDIQKIKDSYEYIKYSGKTISILGDSISTFAGNDPSSAQDDNHLIADGVYTYAGNHCRYPNSYLTNVHDTYWMKLIDTFGMSLGVNDSWAGSRVTWNGTEGTDASADIHIASPTRIGHLDDNGTPDIILVNAGTNDIGAKSQGHYEVTLGTFSTESPKDYTDEQIAALPVETFADAYRTLLIRLQKAYPLAKIVVMLPNYTTSYYNSERTDKFLEVIKEACDYFGVPWVDMRTIGITLYNTSTYMGDGIHPNVNGMALMEQRLEKFFQYEL